MTEQISQKETGASRRIVSLDTLKKLSPLVLMTLSACQSPDKNSQLDLNNVIESQKLQETPIAVYKYGPDQSAFVNLDSANLSENIGENSKIENIFVYSALDTDNSSVVVRMVRFENGKNYALFNQEDGNLESSFTSYKSDSGFLTDNNGDFIYSHFIKIEKDGQITPIPFFEMHSNVKTNSLDQELLTKANNGDQQAYDELLKIFQDKDNVDSVKIANILTGKEVSSKRGDKNWDNTINNLVSILTGATPAQAAAEEETAVPQQSSTPESSPTPENTPTPEVTATPTKEPIPQIQVEEISLPDPKISNPELFDIIKEDSPIPQLVAAMNLVGIEITVDQVLQDINYKELKDNEGNPFVVAFFNFDPNSNQVEELFENPSLFIAQKNTEGNWEWKDSAAKNWTGFFKNKYGQDFVIGYQMSSSKSLLTKAIKSNFNLSMLDGPLHWKEISKITIDTSASPSDNINPVTLTLDLSTVINYIKTNKTMGIDSMTFQHIIWGLKSSSFSETSDDLVNLGGNLRKQGYSSSQIHDIYQSLLIEGVTTIVGTIENNSPYLDRRIFSLVNEPRPIGNLFISGRPQVWADQLGEEYIDLAFMTASPLINQETDVLLINNTDNIGLTPRSNSDLTRLTRVKENLESQGLHTRIGYGIQGTFSENTNWEQFENNIKRFVDAGFEVYITEARVNKKPSGMSEDEWQIRKANILGTAFASALRAGASGFTMFYQDKDTQPDSTKLTPLTSSFGPGPVLYAIENGFSNALAK